jgi:hypothetical protein
VNEEQILAVPDCWEFVPEDDDYDGITWTDDVPTFGDGEWVKEGENGHLYIRGDDGECAFFFKLKKSV